MRQKKYVKLANRWEGMIKLIGPGGIFFKVKEW